MSTTTTHKLHLAGCTPEPLAAYLKALGIFRLVAEQKDPGARACWRNASVFVLHTRLDREALTVFFLEEYQPTPIVAPWNGGSGFYPGDQRTAITTLRQSDAQRLDIYRQVVQQAEQMLARLGVERAPSGNSPAVRRLKRNLCEQLRSALPDEALQWLDAVYVLTSDQLYLPPLLGTGGNDGRLEFTNNFMQNLVSALGLASQQGRSRRRVRAAASSPLEWINDALFDEGNATLSRSSVGQFDPGGVGGANATAGFEAESLVNPWDFVLMMEGALVFAGAAARRLTAESRSKATFPFTVDTSAAGYGTAVDGEASGEGSRAELWVPLWEQPATFPEVSHLFGEGRAQLGKRQASTGTDFARAVIGLGVERGVGSFQRYGFLKRNGLAFIATPLGRFRTREQDRDTSRRANLLFNLDSWLDRLRRAARGQNAPEALKLGLRQIDRAILEFCAAPASGPQQARLLQEVLIAAGHAERWLATSGSLGRNRPNPLHGLSLGWLAEADDRSEEFRLAAALASIQHQGDVGSIRENLEPVEWERAGYWKWAEDDTSVVWRGGDPLQSLTAVLERRCLEARMHEVEGLPLWGRVAAPPADVDRFLNRRVDYQRIADLLLPLAALNWSQRLPPLGWSYGERPVTLSRAYVALKLLFLPDKFHWQPGDDGIAIRLEPSLLPLLRAGRIRDAYQVAHRRLKVSGLIPLFDSVNLPAPQAPTLAAALLLPLSESDVSYLAGLALQKPTDQES